MANKAVDLWARGLRRRAADVRVVNGGSELEEEPKASRNVVVAVDASEEASAVVDSALRMTGNVPSTVLHIVHVFRSSRLDHARVGVPATPPSAIQEAKEAHLEPHVLAARLRFRGPVVGHLAMGEPAAEVLRFCREVKAELLVVGTHEHHGLERWLLGSMAETFVRQADCPVLVVRAPRRR